jgi:hypothetical protein
MIVLIFDPTTGSSDFLRIFSPLALPPATPLEWYVTWNIDPPAPGGLPFGRNFGKCFGGPLPVDMTPPVPAVPVQEYEIRELTVYNPNDVPVFFYISFFNAGFPVPPFSRLYTCVLGAHHTLSYNSVPGIESTWLIFDGAGILTSRS